jgi:hypothetical protein
LNGGKQTPCIHCGRFTLLLDDAQRTAHKRCVEAALARSNNHDRRH